MLVCCTRVSVLSAVQVCACICVCVSRCNHWEWRLCVYMAEVPMTNVVRASSWTGNARRKTCTALPLFFLLKHVLPICRNTWRSFSFAVLQCHYKTMFFVLHISNELVILPISVPRGRVSDLWSRLAWGPAFLLYCEGSFAAVIFQAVIVGPLAAPVRSLVLFPKRYNPHTHHTVSDPCLHDTWQVHSGVHVCVCVWVCEQGMMGVRFYVGLCFHVNVL